ncbi:two-component regulator propeller domain-containing protein [Flavobacterium sp.]|jgi:signal transduction histidine kinase/ligand-binding sensor domain-containing protein/DNA-binding response OmpR family regulator|uniref:two-component regulator propeller domain-containing protein n=1 Tax=Flavobacterium sp. TaxID=239 RepID=UPI0037C1A05D
MIKIISILFYLLTLLSWQKISAQKDALFFKHLTTSNGLSSNRIITILEDKDGFIWFGTGDGINLFNGSSIKKFNVEARCMSLDPKTKNILVGTEKGLELFDKNFQSFKRLNLQNILGEKLNTGDVRALYFSADKKLYVGGDSFAVLNESMTDFKKYDLPKDSNGRYSKIISINVIEKGKVLLGTQQGVWQLNLTTGKYTAVYKNEDLGLITKLFIDKNSNLWICTYSKGICFVKNSNLKDAPIFFKQENGYLINNRVIDMVEDGDQVFLIANIEGGLVRFDKKNNKIDHSKPDIHNSNSLSGKALTTILKDSQNNIWIGTYNSGVNFIDRHRKKFEHYQINFKNDGLFNNNIRAMFQDSRGNIWIGTKEDGGLSKFNRNSGTFNHYKPNESSAGSLSDDYVFCIEEIDPTHLMIGTLKKGIDIFDVESGRFSNILYNKSNLLYNMVYTIHKDLKKRIWVDYGGLFYEFLPQNNTFKNIKGLANVKCVIDENEDHLWIGTYEKGLYLFNTNTKQFKKFDVGSNEINTLKKDSQGNLWVGTNNGLICKKANSKNYITYTIKQGLANNQVLAILIDDNDNIWASTTNGLSKLNSKNKKIKNYYVNDGLQGNEFERYVAFKTKEGELMFGGRNGFNIFHPDKIFDNTSIPKVVITDFNLFNKPVSIGSKDSPLTKDISQTEELTLSNDQSVITFGFVALNHSSPEKNQYAYLLEGFDKDWNYIGNRRDATYTSLPAGDYVFRVKASNSDGYWNNKGASIKITVLPPWWKTFYAYFAYVVVIMLLFKAFYHFLSEHVNLKNNLILEQIEKENNKQLYLAKLQFFTNISHEFRTPLTLILGPLDKLIQSNINNPKLQKQFKLMEANTKRLLRLINQLMDFRKVGSGKLTINVAKYDLVATTKKITDCYIGKAENCSINFTVNSSIDSIYVYFDLEKYDIILNNLLSNAFKFTQNYGNIAVDINLKNTEDGNEFVEISVEDNGKGISEENVKRVFEEFYQVDQDQIGTGIGLSLTEKLVELHKGSIRVESSIGKGSCFTVSLRLGREHFTATDHLLSQDNAYPVEEEFNYLDEYNLDVLDGENSIQDRYIFKNHKKPIKILLVEDNDDLRDYLKENLENYYSVYEAKDGIEGIKECLKVNPDLVISDVMMPNKNGVEMCRDLKTDIRISHIPIILLTARTSSEYKIEGLKTGADAYMEKPFDMRLLEIQIVNLLESRKKLRERFGNEINIAPSEISSSSADDRFLNKAIQIVEDHLAESEFSVDDFVTEMRMSRSSLHIKLKALTNKSTTEFIRSIRLKTAAALIKQSDLSISEIAYKTGFATPPYFSKCFKKSFGILPTDYRNE